MSALGTPAAVHINAFPTRLFAAAEELWAAMLREYALRGLSGTPQPYGPDEIAQACAALNTVSTAVWAGVPPGVGSSELPDAADIGIELGDRTAGDFALLQGVLDDARRLAAGGELLTLPPLPEVVRLRDWLCDRISDDMVGAAGAAWEFEPDIGDTVTSSDPEWDRAILPGSDVAWIVGDDHNRILAVAPAASVLLGWRQVDLVGQRILVVIPPHLRERHVAGFTRSAVTGEGTLLGQPLALSAYTASGDELPVTLTLTRHAARRGRAVFLATLVER